jgi:hypothetical protein
MSIGFSNVVVPIQTAGNSTQPQFSDVDVSIYSIIYDSQFFGQGLACLSNVFCVSRQLLASLHNIAGRKPTNLSCYFVSQR